MSNVVNLALYVLARESLDHPYANGDHVNARWKDGQHYPGTFRGMHGGKAKIEWHDGGAVNHVSLEHLSPRMTPEQQRRHDATQQQYHEVKRQLDEHVQREKVRQADEEVRQSRERVHQELRDHMVKTLRDAKDGYGPKHLFKNPAHWKGDVRPEPKPEPAKRPGFFHRLLKRA